MASSDEQVVPGEANPSTSVISPQIEDGMPIEIVTDITTDIAINDVLEKLSVGVPGRVKLEKIYVRNSGGKHLSYDGKKEAPADDSTLSILSTTQEKEGRPETAQYLVVGLVLAKNHKQYSTKTTGNARDKKRDTDRAQRGILPPVANVLRAIIPVTESIGTPKGTRFYVAINPLHGLCNLRRITLESIFFFEEIWRDISPTIPVKDRRLVLTEQCRKLAAKDKRPPQRAILPISSNSKESTSNLLSIPAPLNAASHIFMQWHFWRMEKQPSSITALANTVDQVLGELFKKPSDSGLLGFFEFDKELQEADALDLVASLKAAYPKLCQIEPLLVRRLHESLRRTNAAYLLPYSDLVLFLRMGQDRAQAVFAPAILDDTVSKIVHDISIMNELRPMVSDTTLSKVKEDEIDLTIVLSEVEGVLRQMTTYLNAQATELREQHGGIMVHSSIQDLMVKISNCVDRTALQAFEEQMFAIHAEQLATANGNAVKYVERCIQIIQEALSKSS